MLGADVLLFPDFGEPFLRSVKTNAVYAKQITSPSLVIPEKMEPAISQWLGRIKDFAKEERDLANREGVEYLKRCLTYCEFVLKSQPTLRLLSGAGVLRAPEPIALAAAWATIKDKIAAGHTNTGNSVDVEWFLRHYELADPMLVARVRHAREQMPPNFLDGIPFLLIGDVIASGKNFAEVLYLSPVPPKDGKFPIETFAFMLPGIFGIRDGLLQDSSEKLFAGLLAVADAAFAAEGCPFVWTDPALRDGMWAVHKILTSTEIEAVPNRSNVEDRLGATIVQAYLPVVHDLPIDEILELRTKHEPELEAFRSGVAELAVSIDLSQSPGEIESQSQDLVRTRVNPAVRDLRSKLKIARLEALQKIGKSWQSLASMTVSTTIAVLAGAPFDFGALAGIAGTIGHAVFDGALERRKLLHANQWAALIQFDDMKS